VSADLLFTNSPAIFAVVASPKVIQIFDQQSNLKLVVDMEGFDIADVRAVSGPHPMIIARSRHGYVSIQPLQIVLERSAVKSAAFGSPFDTATISLKSTPISLFQTATCLEVYLLKSLPRIVLGTDQGKILILDAEGHVHNQVNASASASVSHVSMGFASMLAYATTDGTVGFSSVLSNRPNSVSCQVPLQLGEVNALAFDVSRESRYAYVSTKTGELLVYDRHFKEPVSGTATTSGIRSLLPSPNKAGCLLVHRILNAQAKNLTVVGASVITTPNATLRSSSTKWMRKTLPSSLWAYARASSDYRTFQQFVVVFSADGKGLILRPLPELENTKRGGGGGDHFDLLSGFGEKGPVAIVLAILGFITLMTRGASGFRGRGRDTGLGGMAGARRGVVISDYRDPSRAMGD